MKTKRQAFYDIIKHEEYMRKVILPEEIRRSRRRKLQEEFDNAEESAEDLTIERMLNDREVFQYMLDKSRDAPADAVENTRHFERMARQIIDCRKVAHELPIGE